MADRKNSTKSLTKLQIITNLYKDKFIDERILWNLLNSRFKKFEIEIMDETFREDIGNHKYRWVKGQ